MFFWIILVILIFGVVTSFYVHNKRALPTIISLLALANYIAAQKGLLGPVSLTIMALLAIAIWVSNTLTEKFG